MQPLGYKKILYRYGFAVDTQRVYQEWLYYLPNNQQEEIVLFERSKENDRYTISLGENFKEAEIAKKINIRKNALLLSVVAQLDDSGIAGQILEWFINDFKVLFGCQSASFDDALYC